MVSQEYPLANNGCGTPLLALMPVIFVKYLINTHV